MGKLFFAASLFDLRVFGFGGFDISPFVYPKIGYVCEVVFFAMALARQMPALRRRIKDGLRLAEAE